MARLEFSSSSSGEESGLPWKAIGLVLLIGCSGAYGWYQYVQLNPRPKQNIMAPQGRMTAANKGKNPAAPMLDKLNLTDAQKAQIAAIEKETTNPAKIRREVAKLLTPEQQAKSKLLRDEAEAERKLRQEKKDRMIKAAGGDPNAIKERDKQLQEARRARKQAAEAAASTPGTAK
ncbi:MAG: hypothetical protein K1X53_12900 [Candidatus Sumerlaeaceae bacterium]|nr:hypothetical protein [Candidatus Sumerlaeaceae bacterium]